MDLLFLSEHATSLREWRWIWLEEIWADESRRLNYLDRYRWTLIYSGKGFGRRVSVGCAGRRWGG